MIKYKVKNMQSAVSKTLQNKISEWVTSREHVTIVSVNIWECAGISYCTIIYIENKYNL